MNSRCGLNINDLLQLLLLHWRIGEAKSILSLTRQDPQAPILQLTQEPNSIPTNNSTTKYAWVMADPDAPNCHNPINADWIHWIVIHASTPTSNDGETIVSYQPPNPPSGSGNHHYITILFEYDITESPTRNTIQKIQKQIEREGRGKQKTGALMRDLIGENAQVIGYNSFVESR